MSVTAYSGSSGDRPRSWRPIVRYLNDETSMCLIRYWILPAIVLTGVVSSRWVGAQTRRHGANQHRNSRVNREPIYTQRYR